MCNKNTFRYIMSFVSTTLYMSKYSLGFHVNCKTVHIFTIHLFQSTNCSTHCKLPVYHYIIIHIYITYHWLSLLAVCNCCNFYFGSQPKQANLIHGGIIISAGPTLPYGERSKRSRRQVPGGAWVVKNKGKNRYFRFFKARRAP